ncbi:carbohydrate kinase [Klebsiella michiganensis]|uniref:FGGY-family carbohydrate kinase n=1 Tax=Klebsiella michiganensis TaxID=1134687 RepID=UPI0008A15FD2|nr:FGGY-family carbohydrate kinase [Klebsiella michiganensis]OFU86137.1 carbohydrate kinase [Proteus sp. HMSC10D02]MBA7859411.1 carbohydrate kinase [Klebsiella michiganensis]MBA8052186.1 carbohydrate kinase [Klebsiella michiganensis]MBG2642036.1 carbohydrate kinase [Klebsiella michiganensis]MBL0773118.1 carbohydrate kinase [Klebsiella michiganensis]
MKQHYVMGIDNGGTVTKAAIYDRAGNVVASASKSTQMLTPKEFHTERDISELWAANVEVIKTALAQSGIDASQIKGVAVTGHGNGLYMVDETGAPVRNGIISTDSRAKGWVEKWYRDPTFVSDILPKTMQSIWAGQPVALLAWLKENEPEALNNARYIFMVKDLIRFYLTGEAFLELTDISGTNLINVRDRDYDASLLAWWGLGDLRDKLPPIKRSTDCCGYITDDVAQLTGLCAGTPVSGGVFDISASSVASGINTLDKLAIITGTWSINEYVTDHPVIDRDLFMTSIYPIEGKWLITEASPTSASNLEWFINNFMEGDRTAAAAQGSSVYDLCNDLVSTTTPAESHLLFFPFVFGSNTIPDASAGFIGLNSFHKKAHFLRAIYEGVAFSHLYHTERLRNINPDLSRTIRIAGGVTNSAVWLQIFADIFQSTLEIVDVKEHGTLGTAMTAAVMVGWFDDVFAASNEMVHVSRTVTPNPDNNKVYQDKYQLYKNLLSEMQSPWKSCSNYITH